MRIIRAAGIAIALLPGIAQAMDPGEWKMTIIMSSPAFPKPQVISDTQCIRQGENVDPSKLMGEPQADCKVTVKEKSANRYAWDMLCAQDAVRGSGSVSFTGETMQGEVKIQGEAGGQKIDMLTTMTGKRVGPCN